MVSQQEYDKSKGKSSQGKYNAVHDVTIDGGTWVGTKKFGSNSMVKDGQKTGPNVFNFIHAKNITIKNATIYNVPNAHLIEFCGVKNGVVQNCTLGCYVDADGERIKGYTSGDKKRAAIQLDACDSAENNPLAWPYDHTVCNGITIKNNYVWFYTGVQAAERSKKKTSNVKVNIAHRSDENVNETGFAYLYPHNGTHKCIYNAWFDGRFYNKACVYVKGVTLDDDFGRKQDIVIKNPVVIFPNDDYRYKSKNYYDTDTNQLLDYVVYEYDENDDVWFAQKAFDQCFSLDGDTDYAALRKLFTITPSQARSMGIDANTDTDPAEAVDFTS